jgi:hypothetical protein
MPLWFRIARLWLPIAVVATALVGFTYLAVQQSYRNGADEPQTQLAEDAAAKLDAGAAVSDVVASGSVNIATSLSPFVIVYGPSNMVLEGSGVLQGDQPVPPAGVLDTARSAGVNRVTWQPSPGIRVASVSVATKDGRVVLAGRSLREAERHVDDLGKIALLAWTVTILATLATVAVVELAAGRMGAAG